MGSDGVGNRRGTKEAGSRGSRPRRLRGGACGRERRGDGTPLRLGARISCSYASYRLLMKRIALGGLYHPPRRNFPCGHLSTCLSLLHPRGLEAVPSVKNTRVSLLWTLLFDPEMETERKARSRTQLPLVPPGWPGPCGPHLRCWH